MNTSVYQIITERIISLLEKNVIPWQVPWTINNQPVQNLITRKAYRGINVFLLSSLRYASPFFVSFKQTQDLGGNVKRGEKACPVIYFKSLEVQNKETGKKEHVPVLRYYSVFSVTQCENIKIPVIDQPLREHSPIEAAEKIVSSMPKRPEIKDGMSQAYYSPASDLVAMPSANTFKASEDYYATLFHELTHSTGHESRLNRKGVAGSDGNWSAFGSNPYAREELIAEMGAAFLCGESGIVERTIANSSAYIASWVQKLREDSKILINASAQAQRAADWILGKYQGQITEVPAQE